MAILCLLHLSLPLCQSVRLHKDHLPRSLLSLRTSAWLSRSSHQPHPSADHLHWQQHHSTHSCHSSETSHETTKQMEEESISSSPTSLHRHHSQSCLVADHRLSADQSLLSCGSASVHRSECQSVHLQYLCGDHDLSICVVIFSVGSSRRMSDRKHERSTKTPQIIAGTSGIRQENPSPNTRRLRDMS